MGFTPHTKPAVDSPDNQGEGNREAARRYNESQKDFVEDGRVADAARRAAPHSPEEASELQQAEQQGRSHSVGEDPAVLNAPAPKNTGASKAGKKAAKKAAP